MGTIKKWRPIVQYNLPEVNRPVIEGGQKEQRAETATAVKQYRGYHTVMDSHTSEMLKWVRENVPDDDIAHWEGTTVKHIPQGGKYAMVKAMLRVLNNLPSRPTGDEEDTFNFRQWKEGIYIAPKGSGAGGDGLRPDHLTALVRYSDEFAEALYGYHSYMAHGPGGSGNCTQKFVDTLDADEWTRVLYLLPRWLLNKPKNNKKKTNRVSARVIQGRVDSFMANEWKVLPKK